MFQGLYIISLVQGFSEGFGDESSLEDNLIENEYYSYESLKNTLSNTTSSDLVVMHVNICSLPRRIDDLNNMLHFLNVNPDIIGLSETRITTKVNAFYHPHLENYSFYQSNSSTHSGSVGVFIKNSLSVNPRNDLDISVPGLFETVWFDIDHGLRNKKSTFGIIYRHPGVTDIPFFERRLELALRKIHLKKSDFYIFGDFNCNSLHYDQSTNIKSFVDMMHSQSCVNLINKPTRFPRGEQIGTPSLLDHFYTNQISKVKNIGLLVDDISYAILEFSMKIFSINP